MWDEKQQRNVAELLRQSTARMVCAVTGCSPDELDALSEDAFKCSFEEARSVFAAQGRAMVRQALMQQALDGNMKAIDMICRDQMGMGPVESRAKTIARDDDSGGEEDDTFLAVIRGRARRPA